ncbi:MAG TPA: M20 family peptidase [Chakrabartia sp.]|nr:M20 family peptidase [Chakrabartia sp.]
MGKVGKRLGAATAVLAVIAGVIGYRTATFAPEAVASPDGVTLAAMPAFDEAAAARNLSAAVRFKTVSHQDAAENDWSQWSALHGWLQSTYPLMHKAMVREMVADQTLLFRWDGSDPQAEPIILMAHQDVVPVTPGTEKDWKHAPFDGAIADGAVWGRGSVDDKGSLVCLFEAMEALARQGFKPKRTIYLVSGHDEEVGGKGAKAVADLLKARGVKALFTIDEGSVIVADAPVVNKPAIMIGVAEKGYATLKVTANAPGGHSSMPPRETGVINLAKAVIAINDNQFPLRLDGPALSMLEALAAEKGGATKLAVANRWLFGPMVKGQVADSPSGAASVHTTIAPTMLQGSPKENVLPQSAHALINYRIAPWDRSTDVMARAKEATRGMPVALDWVEPPREPTPVSSTTSEGWRFITAAARVQAKDAVIAPYLVVAGTDSRNFSGVSRDVYRFMPMLFTMKETAMIHGTNEHMSIENLRRMVGFYAQLIATAAG